MKFIDVAKDILHIGKSTYYQWKRENRPIIFLLEKYFSQDELEEFLSTGKVSKLENYKIVDILFKRYFDFIGNTICSPSGINSAYFFFDFLTYFSQNEDEYQSAYTVSGIDLNDFKAYLMLYIKISRYEPSKSFLNKFIILDETVIRAIISLAKDSFLDIHKMKYIKKECFIHYIIYFAFKNNFKLEDLQQLFSESLKKSQSQDVEWDSYGQIFDLSINELEEIEKVLISKLER